MSETVVSSVLRASRARPADGAGRAGARRPTGTIPACQFEVGHRSRVTPRAMQLGAQRPGRRSAPGPWAIRSGLDAERAPDLRRAAPLAGVEGDPQAARPGGLERRGVERAGPGRPPRARRGPSRSGPRRGSGPRSRPASTFAAGSCERSAVQMRRTTVPVLAAASRAPAQTAAIPSASERPRGHVEQRSPADLDVADAVGGLRLDELGGDPLERLGVLHQGDRQVERAQQLGLVGARHRRDERGATSRPRRAAHRRRASGRAPAPCRPAASRRGGGAAPPWASVAISSPQGRQRERNLDSGTAVCAGDPSRSFLRTRSRATCRSSA